MIVRTFPLGMANIVEHLSRWLRPTRRPCPASCQALGQAVASVPSEIGEVAAPLVAQQAQCDLLSLMAHDIRAPLAAILGFAELLQDASLTEEERQCYIGIVKRNGESLAQLISDLLELSRIPVGKVKAEPVAVSVSHLADDVFTSLSQHGAKVGCQITADFSALSDDVSLFIDAIRLQQIIRVLSSHLIRVVEPGTLYISMHTIPVSGQPSSKRLDVLLQCVGSGNNCGQLREIFASSAVVDCLLSQNCGGANLDLCLAHQLARMIGAEIKIDDIGPGQSVRITLSMQANESGVTVRLASR